MFIYRNHSFLTASSEMSQEQKVIRVRNVIAGFLHSWKLEMKVCVQLLSRVRLFATLWSVARQSPLSMEFSRQEYWSGLPFPTPDDLLNPGIEPQSPASAGGFCTTVPPGKLRIEIYLPNIPSFTSLPSSVPNQAKFAYSDRLWKARFSCFHFQI